MRRNRYIRQNGRQNAMLFLTGILILAVAAGYLGTKYFIAPYILKSGSPAQTADTSGTGIVSGAAAGTAVPSNAGIISGAGSVSGAGMTTGTGSVSGSAITPGTGSVSGSGIISGGQKIQDLPAPSSTPGQDQPAAATAENQTAAAASGKFAVQFGSFSTEAAARTEIAALSAQNITASAIEKNGAFKVIGTRFDTKEQARAEAERLKAAAPDAFVTAI